MSEAYKIRPPTAGDLPFIYSRWLLGQYHGNAPVKGFKNSKAPVDYFTAIDKAEFMVHYHRYIEKLLGAATVKVACLVSDPDVILGYSVYFSNTLIWVYVKPDWRKIGIATSLVPQTVDTVASFTRIGEAIRRKKNLKLNPFL